MNYLENYSNFINLISNVNLSKEQLYGMFCNISDEELNAWIEEVRSELAGLIEEDEIYICDRESLANYFHRHPVIC